MPRNLPCGFGSEAFSSEESMFPEFSGKFGGTSFFCLPKVVFAGSSWGHLAPVGCTLPQRLHISSLGIGFPVSFLAVASLTNRGEGGVDRPQICEHLKRTSGYRLTYYRYFVKYVKTCHFIRFCYTKFMPIFISQNDNNNNNNRL